MLERALHEQQNQLPYAGLLSFVTTLKNVGEMDKALKLLKAHNTGAIFDDIPHTDQGRYRTDTFPAVLPEMQTCVRWVHTYA